MRSCAPVATVSSESYELSVEGEYIGVDEDIVVPEDCIFLP